MFKLTDMKKNVLWMMAAILVCGLAAGALMACGDDKDEDLAQDKMEALCHVLVSEDVLKVADITVHYLDAKGQEATERMTTTEWKKQWTTTTLPASIGVWAQLTPKPGLTKENYQLKAVVSAGYLFHAAKGGEWVDGHTYGNPSAEAEIIKANDVEKWCINKPEVRFEVDKQGLCIYSGGNNAFCEWLIGLLGYDTKLCN